tara:strand:+ start:8289 stop:8423 length:135 start_codon:yes stop_codon:yes gene_type:complete
MAKEENKRSTMTNVLLVLAFIGVIGALGYIGAKFNLWALFMVAQ